MQFEVTPNRAAFLAVIEFAEGTGRNPKTGEALDAFRTCYAYRHSIHDLSEHPAVSGEWRGEVLPDAMCRGAGLKPGCRSTAAGRGQLTKATWIESRDALKLPDFGPASQNQALLWQIANRCGPGALDDIDAGRIASAITKCRKKWASFPGAGFAGQPERRMAPLLAVYVKAGGTLETKA